MNKLTDTDLCEALKRKEARRTNSKVPEDFLDNIMQEVAPKRAGRARYTYIAALVASVACILSLMVFNFGDDEMPMPSEPTEKVVAEKATVTPVKEKKAETEEEDKGYYLKECSYGTFSRSVRLPDNIADDKIEAKFKKGVLTIDLPKKAIAPPKSRKIAIK